jgi:hypothetical protein
MIFVKNEKSEIRKRNPRRIKDRNRQAKDNFDKLLAKFTYKSLLAPCGED